MTLNGVMAVILRYFSEFAYLPGLLRKSSRSLSHLLISSCLSLTVEALQGKMCQDLLLSRGDRSVRATISGGRGHPCGIFFGFYKTRHILLSDSANCTVLRAVILTQYLRVSDGLTDRQTELP